MDPTLPLDAFGSVSAPASAPMDSATPSGPVTAASDPSAGAGWKQTAQGLGNVFNNTIGTLRANNGQLTSQPQGQPQQAKPPGGPTGAGSPTLAQQAQILMQKGILSPEQFQRVMASIGGAVPSTGMPEMIAGQSQTPQPLNTAAAPYAVNASPTSPMWQS